MTCAYVACTVTIRHAASMGDFTGGLLHGFGIAFVLGACALLIYWRWRNVG